MVTFLAAACLAVAFGEGWAQKPAPPLTLNGGDHLMYIGTYAGTIQVFDEATETKVADIKLQTGIPRALTLSQSRSKFYVMDSTNEKMEIVDIPTRTTLSTFTLSEGNKKVRIRGFQVDPLERFLILLTRSATRQIDRWEIGDITMQFYDLAQKKITRTIPWPRGEEREFVNIRFSPDGKLLYFFGDDVLILETTNFTEVDTWPLSRPPDRLWSRGRCSPIESRHTPAAARRTNSSSSTRSMADPVAPTSARVFSAINDIAACRLKSTATISCCTRKRSARACSSRCACCSACLRSVISRKKTVNPSSEG